MTQTPSNVAQPGVQPRTRSAGSMVSRRLVLKSALVLLLSLIPIARTAFAQAIPAAEASPISTGFELPFVAGSLQYAISASESLTSGYYSSSGLYSATNLSGDVAYISPAKRYPSSLIFSGGRSWSTSSQSSSTYSNLAMSQVIPWRRWNFVISDSVSYLPETPSTGLSGIPGAGDVGVAPVQAGTGAGQGILTGLSARVFNSTTGSAQRQITGATSLMATGAYTILRFVGDTGAGGIDNTGESGGLGLSHRIDARNNAGVNYAYTRFGYGANQPGIVSQSAMLDYGHQISRTLIMDVSAGPQWTSIYNAPHSTPSTSFAASATLAYTTHFANYALGYSRGTNSGSGVIEGARSDSVRFSASRTFARVWNSAVSSSYSRSTSLGLTGSSSFSPQTVVASIQVSRALPHSLSTYASYTVLDQTNTASAAAVNVFSGLSKVAAFGLTYSPRPTRFGAR